MAGKSYLRLEKKNQNPWRRLSGLVGSMGRVNREETSVFGAKADSFPGLKKSEAFQALQGQK